MNPVKCFLQLIIDDPDLSWGGQFEDPLFDHVDDQYNMRNPESYHRVRALLQAAC